MRGVSLGCTVHIACSTGLGHALHVLPMLVWPYMLDMAHEAGLWALSGLVPDSMYRAGPGQCCMPCTPRLALCHVQPMPDGLHILHAVHRAASSVCCFAAGSIEGHISGTLIIQDGQCTHFQLVFVYFLW